MVVLTPEKMCFLLLTHLLTFSSNQGRFLTWIVYIEHYTFVKTHWKKPGNINIFSTIKERKRNDILTEVQKPEVVQQHKLRIRNESEILVITITLPEC